MKPRDVTPRHKPTIYHPVSEAVTAFLFFFAVDYYEN